MKKNKCWIARIFSAIFGKNDVQPGGCKSEPETQSFPMVQKYSSAHVRLWDVIGRYAKINGVSRKEAAKFIHDNYGVYVFTYRRHPSIDASIANKIVGYDK